MGYALLFWTVAAALIAAANAYLSPAGAAIMTFAVLLFVAFAYTRARGRHGGEVDALGAGAIWLSLSIAAEVLLAQRQGWYLLGPPDRPLLRNLLLFAWAFAPLLFARRES